MQMFDVLRKGSRLAGWFGPLCFAGLGPLCFAQSRGGGDQTADRYRSRSSLKREGDAADDRPKVLLVVGDGSEVMDSMAPFYRLGEDYQVVVAGPAKDVNPDEYIALVLPGGRGPEYLRYDEDLIRITKEFFTEEKPVAPICHGVEILAVADVIRGKEVTTIPKCRFDAQVAGAIYVAEPVVRSGNLLCARGKKDISPWMKTFTEMIQQYLKGDSSD